MELILLYPQFALRDCQHCLEWAYNDKPGTEGYGRIETHNGRPDGRPQKRHPKHLPLCKTQEGCPRGTPEKPNCLSKKNREAYRHFRECKATGHFPDDPIVRMNADLIQGVLDYVAEKKRIDELTAMATALAGQ